MSVGVSSVYPWQESHDNGVFKRSHGGITLRDYFAAETMTALIRAIVGHSGSYGDHFPNEVAALAYKQADAMLAERGTPVHG